MKYSIALVLRGLRSAPAINDIEKEILCFAPYDIFDLS